MAEVERNAALKDQLLLEVAQAGGPLDLASYRRSFADALRSKSAAGGSRSYPRTSGPWARVVHESIARIGAPPVGRTSPGGDRADRVRPRQSPEGDEYAR
jgi:hypothetical protein